MCVGGGGGGCVLMRFKIKIIIKSSQKEHFQFLVKLCSITALLLSGWLKFPAYSCISKPACLEGEKAYGARGSAAMAGQERIQCAGAKLRVQS